MVPHRGWLLLHRHEHPDDLAAGDDHDGLERTGHPEPHGLSRQNAAKVVDVRGVQGEPLGVE